MRVAYRINLKTIKLFLEVFFSDFTKNKNIFLEIRTESRSKVLMATSSEILLIYVERRYFCFFIKKNIFMLSARTQIRGMF